MKKRIISFLLTLVLILSVGPFANATSSRPNVTRLAGNSRYDTAFAAANELKEKLGIAKFNAVIVSSGENFADALAGSYLAAMKDAPIILVRNNNNTLNSVKNYIKANLASGGTVYLLGGENAVPKAMETGLLKIFIEAGCVVSTPTCGPCLGGYMGILAAGERAVATTNRNFIGRMGDVTSEVYLASPAVAAASAIAGRIADPNEIVKEGV